MDGHEDKMKENKTDPVENPFVDLFKNKLNDGDTNTGKEMINPSEKSLERGHQSEFNCVVYNLLVDVFRFVVSHPGASFNSVCMDINHKHHESMKKITLNVVQLPDVSPAESSMTMDVINNLLFERLMINPSQAKKHLIDINIYVNENHMSGSNLVEKNQLLYLYNCYHRLSNLTISDNLAGVKTHLENIIISHAASFLSHTDLYPGLMKDNLLVNLVIEYHSEFGHANTLQKFMSFVSAKIESNVKNGEDDVPLIDILKSGYYDEMLQRFENMSLGDPLLGQYMNCVHYFISTPLLGKLFVTMNSPWKRVRNYNFDRPSVLGRGGVTEDFMSTLLGRLLSISCMPRQNNPNFEHFLTPSRYSAQEHDVTEKNLGNQLNILVKELHQIFLTLLKQIETRNLLLNWIGLCLYAFKDRAKMWTNEMAMISGGSFQISDGFLINFAQVLLQLCEPFSAPHSPRLLKIDHRYCRSKPVGLSDEPEPEASNCIYLRDLKDETFFVPSSESISVPSDIKYNFMTDIFYATHRALQLGFRACHERFLLLASDLGQMQRVFEEARLQGSDSSDGVEMVRRRMDKGMTQFLNMKTVLALPEWVELMLKFHVATSTWLSNIAMAENELDPGKKFKEINIVMADDIKDSDSSSKCLQCIPEFIMENITDMVIFVRRFTIRTLALPTITLSPIMTLIMVFMGNPSKMKNPHLRARLAEVLEALMPRTSSDSLPSYGFNSGFDIGAQLFSSHPYAEQLAPSLIHVFVSIEMTGQSVQFEQKFQYRRPMYNVLKYLWSENSGIHRRKIFQLAVDAENNMEAANAPLFLRFINLLTNDAIFLLDEALSYMSKLRELQQERQSGAWNNIPQMNRQQNEANFHHLGRLARFHNVIGRDTISTLSWLTEDIKTIFCHKTMVDRIAAMLNYFLLHLVGPKKKNFKVRDMGGEYDFKPAEIVSDICTIYINLGSKKNKKAKQFCLAIANDDRAYSADLLPLASEVLIKTGKGGGGLPQEIEQLGVKIEKLFQIQAKKEIDLNDVPDEFLDPIMSTIMTDPVTLPSGYIVDRSTIARHLLSDQTDPFTRLPLSMELVKPHIDLKKKIEDFVAEYQKQKLEKEAANDENKNIELETSPK